MKGKYVEKGKRDKEIYFQCITLSITYLWKNTTFLYDKMFARKSEILKKKEMEVKCLKKGKERMKKIFSVHNAIHHLSL